MKDVKRRDQWWRHLKLIIGTTERVGYYGCYYLIVPDHAAGHRGRYTVYRIPASPSRRVKIVGRELPLAYARKYARKLQAT
jgi:hypothetical protein